MTQNSKLGPLGINVILLSLLDNTCDEFCSWKMYEGQLFQICKWKQILVSSQMNIL